MQVSGKLVLPGDKLKYFRPYKKEGSEMIMIEQLFVQAEEMKCVCSYLI
jgi:hypothetical protein